MFKQSKVGKTLSAIPDRPGVRIGWFSSQRQQIRSVSVIGAGAMGQGIATAAVHRGIPVTITDASADILSKCVADIRDQITANRCSLRSAAIDNADGMDPIRPTTSDAELARSDLVIEAVVEKLDVKKRILSRLEAVASDRTILASNTSSISIGRIAEALGHPERFCGIHFCHPVPERALVEVIRGSGTSDETVSAAVDFAECIGKKTIVVTGAAGSLVNRLLSPYLNEALELVVEGVPVETIETAATSFGMPMGPIGQIDAYGIDVVLRAGRLLSGANSERDRGSELLVELYKAGRLGRKAGAGFYRYSSGSRRPDDGGQLDRVAAEIIRARVRGRKELPQAQIINRLLLPMLVEATKVLEEELVESPGDVDLAVVHGFAFPASKGGLLGWADSLGAAQIIELLKQFEELGPRYRPTRLLVEAARNGSELGD